MKVGGSAILPALFWLVLTRASVAQMRRPILDPLPSELRTRVAELMRTLRPAEVEATVAHATILDGPLWRDYGVLFLRIEVDCDRSLCMTIIAKVTDHAIVPELILRAGSTVTFTDEGILFWGAREASFPILFEGADGSTVEVHHWKGRWVVEASGNSSSLPDEQRPVLRLLAPSPKPPAPKSPEATFEHFRRTIDRDR